MLSRNYAILWNEIITDLVKFMGFLMVFDLELQGL